MSGKIRTRLTILAASAALVAVILPATLATGQEEVTGDGSVVLLKLGDTDEITSEEQTQNISTRGKCTNITIASSPSLLSITASGGDLGIVKDGIGVQGPNDGNGEPCGRIQPPEAVSVALGSDLSGHLMNAVDLDLELKFDAHVDIVYRLDGDSVAEDDFNPMGDADDGPDSGDGDNYRYHHEPGVLFDEVLLTAVAGAFSLEGGADGTDEGSLDDNNFSQFQIVQAFDGDITCGQTETLSEDGVSTSGDVTMHSEDKGEGWIIDDCDLKPYNRLLTDESLAFVPELEGTMARYTIEITVEDQVIVVDSDGTITSLTAVYDPEPELSFPDGADESPLQACLTEPILNMNDEEYEDFWTATNVGLLPDGETACWYSSSVEPSSEDVGTEFWGIYFEDDPGFSFK